MTPDDRTLIENAARDLHRHFCERRHSCGHPDRISEEHARELFIRISAAVEVTCDTDLGAIA